MSHVLCLHQAELYPRHRKTTQLHIKNKNLWTDKIKGCVYNTSVSLSLSVARSVISIESRAAKMHLLRSLSLSYPKDWRVRLSGEVDELWGHSVSSGLVAVQAPSVIWLILLYLTHFHRNSISKI